MWPAFEQAVAFERALLWALRDDYPRAQADSGYDAASRDGFRILELKFSLLGARDLHAALLKLGMLLAEHPEFKRATLVFQAPRMNPPRIAAEWRRVCSALQPHIADRLALVGVAAGESVAIPDGAEQQQLLQAVHRAVTQLTMHQPAVRWSRKQFLVWRALLDALLRNEGPIRIRELGRRSGCSYPTVSNALDRLLSYDELTRSKGGSVSFSEVPRASLGEVLSLSNTLRETVRFVDSSGRPPDREALLRRLEARAPQHVALGGVVAARRYLPEFDLIGLPRLDVVSYGPLSWVAQLDPALREAGPQEAAPALVVHTLPELPEWPETLKNQAFPLAPRADVLLDVYDLRLAEQGDAFARLVRRGGGNSV